MTDLNIARFLSVLARQIERPKPNVQLNRERAVAGDRSPEAREEQDITCLRHVTHWVRSILATGRWRLATYARTSAPTAEFRMKPPRFGRWILIRLRRIGRGTLKKAAPVSSPSPKSRISNPLSSGSVLILTLWTLFFLGAMALAIGGHVSADLRLAMDLRWRVTATALARAGAERAAMAVLESPTNWTGIADADLGSDEAVFKDNDSLEGGTFSVRYEYVDTESGIVSTNFGVVVEARKININRPSEKVKGQLVALGVPVDVAENILQWSSDKRKRFANEGRTGYSALYESPHELLAVDGLTEELYWRIVPHVTIFGGQTFFSGVSEGVVQTPGDDDMRRAVASRRIAFVFDRKKASFVHWYEF